MTGQNDPATVLRAYIPPKGAVRIVDPTGKVKVAVQSAEGIESY